MLKMCISFYSINLPSNSFVRIKSASTESQPNRATPQLQLDCRRRATVGRAVPIYRSITVVIKSNKGKRDDRFDHAAATKCHVAVLSRFVRVSDKTTSFDITEVKYRETSRGKKSIGACLSCYYC